MIDTQPPISFCQLLAKHDRIHIPRLQRDYAQGRKGARETGIRRAFLKALVDALKAEVNDRFAPLNLDFVYGNKEALPQKHFSPLDGQQRLTTLFLLHWVLAWRDGCREDFTKRFCEGEHARFSYRVRTSSREFLDDLVKHWPPTPAAELKDLRGWITDQDWYFRYWRLDPTVQGVLEMLQEMHECFAEGTAASLYARLVDEAHPAITFQLLDLGEFPLSDDLYIKMNARGKVLTAFETFKARYEDRLDAHFKTTPAREIGGESFAMAEFVKHRFDTAWTDIFWKRQLNAPPPDPDDAEEKTADLAAQLDDSFMNLFRMVALATRDPESPDFRADLELLTDREKTLSFQDYEDREWLDAHFSALLVSLMESWCISLTWLPGNGLFKEAKIVGQAFDNPTGLTVPETFLFCGYALFIRKHEGHLDVNRFDDWMRIVHNLGINSEINGLDRLQAALKSLRDLLPHTLDILPYVAGFGPQAPLGAFYDLPQHEESLKAALLLADPAGWKALLHVAESHGYFTGQVDFLLDFSGTKGEWEKTWNCAAWDADAHRQFQQAFAHYLQRAKTMFGDKGLADLGEARWQRALLSVGNYLLLRGYTNHSFLVDARNEPDNWRRLLRGTGNSDEGQRRPYLKRLWDKMDPAEAALLVAVSAAPVPTAGLLDAVIAGATNLEPWREAFVRNAAAVTFCRTVQFDDSGVYLLATTQRKGRHAELFSYVLDGQLRQADSRQPITPLQIGEYYISTRREDWPHLPLRFSWMGTTQDVQVHGSLVGPVFWIKLPLPADLHSAFTQAGFVGSTDSTDWLERPVALGDAEPALRDLARRLTPP